LWIVFPSIHGLFIFQRLIRIKNDYHAMEFRMKIIVPNEILRGFHPLIK
jgi:hypothetical protein